MVEADRELIHNTITAHSCQHVLITHGTDSMVETGKRLQSIQNKTIVITGALNPARFHGSDAHFNIGCAIGALQSLSSGVYIAMNGRIWHPDKVRKNIIKKLSLKQSESCWKPHAANTTKIAYQPHSYEIRHRNTNIDTVNATHLICGNTYYLLTVWSDANTHRSDRRNQIATSYCNNTALGCHHHTCARTAGVLAEHSGSKSVTHLDSAPNRIRDEIASRRITSTKQSKSRYGDDLSITRHTAPNCIKQAALK